MRLKIVKRLRIKQQKQYNGLRREKQKNEKIFFEIYAPRIIHAMHDPAEIRHVLKILLTIGQDVIWP